MLKILRQGQRWLTAIFVIGVGGVFVFFMGWGAPATTQGGATLVEVGPYRYGLREFERARQQREAQYQEALGDEFDAQAMKEGLDQMAVETLIQRSILAMEAQSLGLSVAKSEIERSVLASASFRDEGGRFDRDAFESWAAWEFGNQRNFLADQRLSLLATKMLRLVEGMAHVSEGEARDAVTAQREQVRIAFVALEAGEPPEGFDPGESEVGKLIETRDAEVRKRYEEQSERFNAPERVRARHILLRVPAGASDTQREAVRQRADEVLGRLRAGESFAELAGELSEDPGSREKGGDLGLFGRGQMVKPFEDAAFALEPGSLSEVVPTDFGFHVIRTEEYRPAESRSYEEVRAELAREMLGRDAARAQARATAEALAAAIREGQSLEEAARGRGLTLERSGWLNRRPDGFVPGLGAAQDLLAVAFTLPAGQSAPRIFEVGDKISLVQVLEREVPAPEQIAAEVSEQQERLRSEERQARIQAWLSTRRAALLDSGQLAVNLDDLR